MTLLFSPEELIQYVYQETSPEKTTAIEEALRTDWSLREKVETLKSTLEHLDKITDAPRTETIVNILRYARETMPASSH